MTKQAALLFAALSLTLAALACGSSNFSATDDAGTGEPDATVDDGSSGTIGNDGAGDTATADATPPPNDGGVFEASPDVNVQDVDIPPVDGGDAACNDVPSEAVGAIVAPGGTGTGTTGCTLASPCPTISEGLLGAKNFGKTIIYVDQGVYSETLNLVTDQAAGELIQGGWKRNGGSSGGWMRGRATPARSQWKNRPSN